MKLPADIPLPAYILDEAKLIRNLSLIKDVKDRAGVSVILALKGFAMWSVFPLVKEYLDGATASSLHEAMLIEEHMGCKAHTYCAAYVPEHFDAILNSSSHIVFNSLSEYERYKHFVEQRKDIQWGLRVNPGYSEVGTDLYNPCTPGSRLGIPSDQLQTSIPDGISGLHFHALCENDSYTLERVLASFERLYGHLLPQLKWINMGGGHLMTREGYDVEHLIGLLKRFKEKWRLEIIMEPGSAIAWQTGDLFSRVLDIVENQGVLTAMLDVSFTAHMPDTLEMPYKPLIEGASDPVPDMSTYRMGGMSCLSGDYIDGYSFDSEMNVGDIIQFKDMMHYTMVKTTTFNGVQHPAIILLTRDGEYKLIKQFEYSDYRNRLS
jgi:carboxynorspermidine decarboxylase